MYKKIKKWYFLNLWTKQMVLDAVRKNVITAEDAKTITEDESE